MNKKLRNTVSNNTRALMAHFGWAQMDLAKKAQLSQKTISNILNDPSRTLTLESLEAIAKAFGVMPWQLLIAGQPTQQLLNRDLDKLVKHYTKVEDSGKLAIVRLAESELKRKR